LAHFGAGPDTVYEIGSITKTMTSLLLAEAVESGELSADATLGSLLDVHSGQAAGVALEELASHRSGLPRVGVRRSDTAGYVLRVLPSKHKWQYFRDPKGAAGSKLEASGSGKFVKLGSKPNMLAIRAFSRGGTTTSVIASVNGHGVVNATDSGADQPDGRQTVVTSGAKGSGSGAGITGVFDNVTVQVPNPFG
jgi:CubicO group peptidase (beta-lactamase class C family)